MLTVVETLLFQRQWPLYWTEEERGEFAAFIATDPLVGVVVRDSGGTSNVSSASRARMVTTIPSGRGSPSTMTFPPTTVPVASCMT